MRVKKIQLYVDDKFSAGIIVYTLRINFFTYFFNLPSPIKMNIIGPPVSISCSGLIGDQKDTDSLIQEVYKKEHGLVLCLNSTPSHYIAPAVLMSTLPTIIMEHEYATIDSSDDVKIVDMILETEDINYHIKNYHPDVIGITGYITNIPQMIEYSKSAKAINPDIKTVVGGVYVEKFPEDAEHGAIDFRVIRNASRTFPKLLEHIKGNGEKPNGVLGKNEKQDKASLPEYDFHFPLPRRDLTSHYHDRYFYVFHHKVALMKTSFGCPYKCDFCFCRKVTDDKYYARPVEDIIAELKSIPQREIYFVDDDFLFSRKRLKAFFSGLRKNKLDKKFLVYGRADFIADNNDLIKEFKELGLRTVIVGLESFSDDELNSFNKQSSASLNERAMKVLNANKVDCYAAVILSPDWTDEQFKMTSQKLIELGVKFVNFQPLTPLPGTGVQVPEEKLVISRKEFAKWDLAHVAIMPEKMSLAAYYKNIIKAYDRVTLHWKFIVEHLKRYPVWMFIKVLGGGIRVRFQYMKKYKEALRDLRHPIKGQRLKKQLAEYNNVEGR